MTVTDEETSNLVKHAQRELALTNEEPSIVEPVLKIVEIFSGMGHSGFSAFYTLSVLDQLLQFKNLSPLTDDPDEWIKISGEIWPHPEGVWQNRRNGEAFSHNGGKTYYLLSEGASEKKRKPLHIAQHVEKK